MTGKTITVQYFALLREARGLSEESLQTSAETPLALYRELQAKYHFPWDVNGLKVAVNEVFSAWDTPLQAQDVVVFIPPVAGG